jgi:hypothetical protein
VSEDIELELQCKYCDYEELLNVPESDYNAWAGNGVAIQEVFDYLSAGQRELMVSGTCDTCWDKFFPMYVRDAEEDEDTEDVKNIGMIMKIWTIWAKALGEKVGEDKQADRVAIIRTLIVLQAVICNGLIVWNIIRNW